MRGLGLPSWHLLAWEYQIGPEVSGGRLRACCLPLTEPGRVLPPQFWEAAGEALWEGPWARGLDEDPCLLTEAFGLAARLAQAPPAPSCELTLQAAWEVPLLHAWAEHTAGPSAPESMWGSHPWSGSACYVPPDQVFWAQAVARHDLALSVGDPDASAFAVLIRKPGPLRSGAGPDPFFRLAPALPETDLQVRAELRWARPLPFDQPPLDADAWMSLQLSRARDDMGPPLLAL